MGTELVKAEAKLINYNAAMHSLAEAVRVDEVKHIVDLAVAAQVYAKMANDTTMLDNATEIKIRAQRRIGEIIIEMRGRGELARQGSVKGFTKVGGDETSSGRKGSTKITSETSKSSPKTAADLGITRDQSSAWRRLAEMPQEKFEEKIAASKGRTKVKRQKSERQPIHKLGLDLFNFKAAFIKEARKVIRAGGYTAEARDTLIDILSGTVRDCEALKELLDEQSL